MRNIVFDVGNTYTKYAVFCEQELVAFSVVEKIQTLCALIL